MPVDMQKLLTVGGLSTVRDWVTSKFAPTFSDNASYKAGQYVIYSGKLFEFILDHVPGAWAGTDAIEVGVGDSLDDLLSAIRIPADPPVTFEQGSISSNNGQNASGTLSTTRCRTQSGAYIPVPSGGLDITSESGNVRFYVFGYNESKTYNGKSSAIEWPSTAPQKPVHIPASYAAFIRMSASFFNDYAITPADVDIVVKGWEVTDKSISLPGKAPDAAAVREWATETFAVPNGYYDELTAGAAEQLISFGNTIEKIPYLFRASGGSKDIGNREMDTIVGGTLLWNQLAPDTPEGYTLNGVSMTLSDGVFTITTTDPSVENRGARFPLTDHHVYLYWLDVKTASSMTCGIKGDMLFPSVWTNLSPEPVFAHLGGIRKTTTNCVFMLAPANTQDASGEVSDLCVFDLTAMFGSTIAEYVLSLETATVGAGIAWFRKLFPLNRYPYDAGTLLSVNAGEHRMVGFNAYDYATGKAKLLGGHEYQITGAYSAIAYEDLNGNAETITPDTDGLFTPLSDGVLTVTGGNATTTCVHLTWSGYRNGEWEEYEEHTYPLDSSLTLRGVPRLDAANNLYYSGDTYESDGTVTRHYAMIDLGTLTWTLVSEGGHNFRCEVPNGKSSSVRSKPAHGSFAVGYTLVSEYPLSSFASTMTEDKTYAVVSSTYPRYVFRNEACSTTAEMKAAMSGVMFLYEVATPTTEAALPFSNPQIVEDFGTEEYTDATFEAGTRAVAIPVGHDTQYTANLRDKLRHLPDPASEDGSYLISQSNEDMTLTPLSNVTNSAMIYRGTLDEENDLDTIKAPGVYSWGQNHPPANYPTVRPSVLLVISGSETATRCGQLVINRDGRVISRYQHNGEWSDWRWMLDSLNNASIPPAPTTDGAYRLSVTVSGGEATYTWVTEA